MVPSAEGSPFPTQPRGQARGCLAHARASSPHPLPLDVTSYLDPACNRPFSEMSRDGASGQSCDSLLWGLLFWKFQIRFFYVRSLPIQVYVSGSMKKNVPHRARILGTLLDVDSINRKLPKRVCEGAGECVSVGSRVSDSGPHGWAAPASSLLTGGPPWSQQHNARERGTAKGTHEPSREMPPPPAPTGRVPRRWSSNRALLPDC